MRRTWMKRGLSRFADSAHARNLRKSLSEFKGVPDFDLPGIFHAELRPYQKDGFHFLCHLTPP